MSYVDEDEAPCSKIKVSGLREYAQVSLSFVTRWLDWGFAVDSLVSRRSWCRREKGKHLLRTYLPPVDCLPSL